MAGVSHFADHRKVELPFVKDRFGKILTSGLKHHQHAFLGLAQHHFIRCHPGFAARHHVHVEDDARFAVGRHFDA